MSDLIAAKEELKENVNSCIRMLYGIADAFELIGNTDLSETLCNICGRLEQTTENMIKAISKDIDEQYNTSCAMTKAIVESALVGGKLQKEIGKES